jgi:SAM-dependent methyltransferase
MVSHYYKNKSCRLCGDTYLELVVPLGESPISEKYLTSDNRHVPSLAAPLNLYFCSGCHHVQLIDVVDPNLLWSDFTFETGRDHKLIQHFQDYAGKVRDFGKLSPEDLVVDVGSNDGTLLECFKELGFANVLGIDPATEIVEAANQRGINTISGFMNDETSERIRKDYGKAKLISANNVYAHVDDLSGMTRAIKNLLSGDGLFVFEASYLLDVVEKNLIGTIFHEHLSYHSLISLEPFLKNHGLEIVHVERGPEQGGSIVGYVQHNGGPYERRTSVQELLQLEAQAGLHESETVRAMYQRLEELKSHIVEFAESARSDGKVLSGFGAARAGTTLLSYFGIGKHLSHLFDDNESKHFKFSPGDKLEVLPTSNIYRVKPDALLILAWIHADKIIASHQQYLREGGRFVRLFPKFEVVS